MKRAEQKNKRMIPAYPEQPLSTKVFLEARGGGGALCSERQIQPILETQDGFGHLKKTNQPTPLMPDAVRRVGWIYSYNSIHS